MDVPHNEKRFAGYDKDSKELDAETMQKYIMVRICLSTPFAVESKW